MEQGSGRRLYRLFSGGAYVKRWQDEAGLQRYTADPAEISLVDLPCLQSATFEMIKADGASERRGFVKVVKMPTSAEVAKRAEELAKPPAMRRTGLPLSMLPEPSLKRLRCKRVTTAKMASMAKRPLEMRREVDGQLDGTKPKEGQPEHARVEARSRRGGGSSERRRPQRHRRRKGWQGCGGRFVEVLG